MHFANPNFLYLLLALPLIAWYRWKYLAKARMVFSNTKPLESILPTLRARLRNVPDYLRYGMLALLIIAMARPQTGKNTEEIANSGIDIMMILDTSSSMMALDFQPGNRFEAARDVAKEFVKSRKQDRIGIVVFGGMAYTQCPLTIDHESVLNFLDQAAINMTEVDGTAIGSAIATATNRIKNTPGKSKVIILLTDGRNNRGEIDPITAAQTAAALDIKIYTVGAGKPGGALYPVDTPFGRQLVKMSEQELDEDTLAKIAETTNGRYFCRIFSAR
jgi:Ca-activated chloride channel family protein